MATGEAKADGVVGDPGGVDGVVGSDVVDEILGSLDGGIDGLFLPEYVLGSRVLLAKEHGEFELDNTSLLAEGGPAFPSVAFRLSPSLPDKHKTKVAHWGSRLRGHLRDGWLRVAPAAPSPSAASASEEHPPLPKRGRVGAVADLKLEGSQ